MSKFTTSRIGNAVAAISFCVFVTPAFAFSGLETNNWLDVERIDALSQYDKIEQAKNALNDTAAKTASASRDMRTMIEGTQLGSQASLDDLETSQEIDADIWLESLPVKTDKASAQLKSECLFNVASGVYECETIAPKNLDREQLAKYEPQILVMAPTVNDTPVAKKQFHEAPYESPKASATQVFEASHSVKLFRGAAGIVTTDGGKINITHAADKIQLVLSSEVKRGHVSMFVRDPSIITLDQNGEQLAAHKSGATELFVVSRDRISIIPVQVADDLVVLSTNAVTKKQVVSNKVAVAQVGPQDLNVPSSLASLDTLDKAAAGVKAAFGLTHSPDAAQLEVKLPDDLAVPSEISDVDSAASANVSFVHAKTKATFGKTYVRVIDERSTWDLSQVYPAGGLRVKLLGTEFDERTDSQGYLEISDVPTGARLLAEIIDDTGATMPTLAEIVLDGSSNLKANAQVVMVRRYVSLDYAARMAGVVQNMEKSSLCGTILDSTPHKKPLSGVRVGVEVAGAGPFYFNEFGYLDTRMPSTGVSGRFCFFNVESGAVNLGIQRDGGDQVTHATVVLTAAGRHTEEFFALDDARHITTTVASVPTASEQLSSNTERSSRYLAADQAEVLPIGYKDAMVAIDDGVYTSTTPIIPMHGRVWTVANSNDYEVSVQAASVKLPGSRQITSLLPRGFVEDMMTYAQATHDLSLGVVVVEHAAIAGQGSDAVKIRLVDARGKDAGDGWYFADQPIAKAVFFNVPPGVYGVLVETSSGHWLAADTVVSFNETSSFVRTGAPLEKHLLQSSAQN